MTAVTVVIPGPPVAQGRGRAVSTPAGVRIFDPKKSRSWKGVAQVHMREAMGERTPFEGPVYVNIRAIFPCPKGDHRKRIPAPLRWHTKASADADNVAKAVLDAGNGIIWLDDRQVSTLEVRKLIAAQSGNLSSPGVIIDVWEMEDNP